jgi:hypothetical protein
METTERGPARHSAAEDDCSDDGRRLPSGGELRTFADADGITLTSGHWTDDVADTTTAFRYFAVSDGGNGTHEASDELLYRCVAGAGIG